MTRLVVTGGRLRNRALGLEEGNSYSEARLGILDTSRSQVAVGACHRTPKELLPVEQPSHVFKAGSVVGRKLAVVTLTEVVVYDLGSLKCEKRWSHPWFNDLHHVDWIDGKWWVVDTGLDSVVTMTDDGAVVGMIGVADTDTWTRFDPEQDYRKVGSTKPHNAHPNHIVQTPEGTWVTRFEHQDAVSVDDPSRRLSIPFGPPHDGIVFNGLLWFTTVNGHLVGVDAKSGQVRDHIDLAEIERRLEPGLATTEGDHRLGWCRGLAFAEGLAFVGFSRLRPTSSSRNLRWFSKESEARPLPTRVVAYNLQERDRVGVWDLERSSAQIDAVFSVLPID